MFSASKIQNIWGRTSNEWNKNETWNVNSEIAFLVNKTEKINTHKKKKISDTPKFTL